MIDKARLIFLSVRLVLRLPWAIYWSLVYHGRVSVAFCREYCGLIREVFSNE